ncbi:conserved protein of unknown function [Modestobacter italicus]|uniref:DinB family protein n=1 Tax=Modestobacter italicus (strain DSM 44449 / CECT 9708 / BC 501) TaxID=2732864 RepID=I4F0U5_MODI5|nr:DUF664 domain-containing protein [Modestobacter marinus]CCH89258.1 conserved protein of unknown function [Modestobacter marinus]
MTHPAVRSDTAVVVDVRAQLDAALDHYRAILHDCLDGLSEEEARRSLVPSRTTLLGLVKHVTYVETFYLQHRVTGQPLSELGVASTPDRSFVLTQEDTIASVRQAHTTACRHSRDAAADLAFGGTVHGRDEQSVVSVYLRLLHDLVHHCGHADILREQVLAAR